MSMKSAGRFAIVLALSLALNRTAGAGFTANIVVSPPSQAGTINLECDSTDPVSKISIPIPANITAAQKALMIAAAITNTLGGSGWTGTAAGNSVQISGVVGMPVILSDSTGETTQAYAQNNSSTPPITSISYALATNAVATGVNASGSPSTLTFGMSADPTASSYSLGVTLHPTAGMTSAALLSQMASAFAGDGFSSSYSSYTSSDGTAFTDLNVNVAGAGYDSVYWGSNDTNLADGGDFVVPSVVPEPRSLFLLATGACSGLGFFAWRRRTDRVTANL